MKRRELITTGALGAIGTLIGPRLAAARPPDRMHNCADALFTETTARAIIAETGEWKYEAGIHGPMLVTRNGCCGCEVTSIGKNEWAYKMRSLTVAEREAFKQEYGSVAALLICCSFGDHEIRGFILNGRYPGWNLSTQRRVECLAS